PMPLTPPHHHLHPNTSLTTVTPTATISLPPQYHAATPPWQLLPLSSHNQYLVTTIVVLHLPHPCCYATTVSPLPPWLSHLVANNTTASTTPLLPYHQPSAPP
nr:hypothetical protein [Tanacetum cinerariifolium]